METLKVLILTIISPNILSKDHSFYYMSYLQDFLRYNKFMVLKSLLESAGKHLTRSLLSHKDLRPRALLKIIHSNPNVFL